MSGVPNAVYDFVGDRDPDRLRARVFTYYGLPPEDALHDLYSFFKECVRLEHHKLDHPEYLAARFLVYRAMEECHLIRPPPYALGLVIHYSFPAAFIHLHFSKPIQLTQTMTLNHPTLRAPRQTPTTPTGKGRALTLPNQPHNTTTPPHSPNYLPLHQLPDPSL